MNSMESFKSGMIAQDQNLQIIGNNLANVNTAGYKATTANFQDAFYETLVGSGTPNAGEATLPQPNQVGQGVKIVGQTIDLTQGPLQHTGKPTELAIVGEGFFVVQVNGQPFYTRDGSFKLNANGDLVTNEGYPIEPAINVPLGATALSISESGLISAILPGQNNPQQLGQLQIALFINAAGLTRVGKNLYQAGGASGTPQVVNPGAEGAGFLQQGHVEGSNASVVNEMVRMILAQRAFEAASKGVKTSDEMMEIANNLKR